MRIVALALVLLLACMSAPEDGQSQDLNRAPVGDGELEYQVQGNGEPVLLIHGSLIADSFLPLMSEPALSDYRLIRFHRRGYVDSAELNGPFSIEQQAADALAVLRHLGVRRAHIVGHSYGAVIALQLAFDAPEVVHSLVLLEPPLMHLVPDSDGPSVDITPAVLAYQSGDTLGAVETFARLVGGPMWADVVSSTVPGGEQQARRDGWTFFEVELPALGQWKFDASEATAVIQPILFVRGAESSSDYEGVGEFLHARFPDVDSQVLGGVNHLLPMQNPHRVAVVISDFLVSHVPGESDGR